ncbi:MAG: tetratricopeptide repeat protein [Oribacterium sp.]
MEKYEFNIKVEQMRKMAGAGDYQTAMQIADGIDWRRVRNANLLASVSEIYEKNGEYEEAKDILLMAFDRAPVGKRFLFKLSEISIKAGNLPEAEEFYREFCDVSPEDSGVYLLRYMILRTKGAGAEQLAELIEAYTSAELDERWLYELAALYEKSGRIADCVKTCDRITLLFGQGQYVEKALELKKRYYPLTERQQSLAAGQGRQHEEPDAGYYLDDELPEADWGQQADRQEEEKPLPASASEKEPEAETAASVQQPQSEEIAASVQQNEEAADAATTESAAPAAEERGFTNPALAALQQGAPKTQQVIREMLSGAGEAGDAAKRSAEKPQSYHMIIEAASAEAGFRVAVNEIKFFHEKYGLEYKVAKINAEKLNERGFAPFIEKLQGKDLIIENAGALSYPVVDELSRYIEASKDQSSIVLVDIVDHFDRMAEDKPQFIQRFDLVSAVPEEKEEALLEEVSLTAPASPGEEKRENEAARLPRSEIGGSIEESRDEAQQRAAAQLRASLERPSRPLEAEERIQPERVEGMEQEETSAEAEMSLEEFADYAKSYAKSIDCSIPERAETALYEKLELMQEDGVCFVKRAAEDLIEEAADRAEKPKLFRPKYDKDDKLILHEDCFL